jgi:hypothetical protein
LRFELLGFRALITHLQNKASITSFGSMRPRPLILLFAQQSNKFTLILVR